MSGQISENRGLSSFRKEKAFTNAWWRLHFPFLFSWKSDFYFGLVVVLIGFAWCGYGLIENSFSMALNWDYSHQYLPFAQHYHDVWRTFFSTGSFPLWSEVTFLGEDNIGANAYYGLFDPFILVMSLFPRSWVPQLFALSTIIKITMAVFFAKAFLRYRGISEGAARFGALAIGFSGYMNFMVGFPTFVSALTYVPLVLLGIEKTIKEKKISCLVWGLFLMMLSCFLLVVTICIWGVIYAVWRYFLTIKERNKADNFKVISLGVGGFALGLLLGAWVLLPSFRMSSLTGRTTSIGSAYLSAFLSSLKAGDLKTAFYYFFLEVGENPGREIMGYISFFFPTGGFTALPLLKSTGTTYDAWTASIFCYTPFVVLFFQGIIFSLKEKKWSHIVAIFFCLLCLFTTFAYYFFFAFSGNGYGRWYFVLVPSIVYYGCWAYDQRKDSPHWIPFAGTLFSLVLTIVAYCSIYWMLKDKTFSGVTHVTYYPTSYSMPDDAISGLARNWYLYYQAILVGVEGVIMVIGYRKKWLDHVLFGFIAVEAIVMGNMTFLYNGLWSIKNSYMGGSENLSSAVYANEAIKKQGDLNYRVYFDQGKGTNNFQYAAGAAGSSSFHSLISYADTDFAYMNYMMCPPSIYSGKDGTYGEKTFVNYGWSAAYRNRRYGMDVALGYRYYVTENHWDNRYEWVGQNVPFGASEIEEASSDRNRYRVYRVDEDHLPVLGHGVDPSMLYRMNVDEDNPYSSDWVSRSPSSYNAHRQSLRMNEVLVSGAIIDDDVTLPEEFAYATAPTVGGNPFGLATISYSSGLSFYKYEPLVEGDRLFPNKGQPYGSEGTGYFIKHHGATAKFTSATTAKKGIDHIVVTKNDGTSFCNEDGAYFQLTYHTNITESSFNSQPKVMMFDANDRLVCYDASTLGNVAAAGLNAWWAGRSSSIGLYATGEVKTIAFIWPYSAGATSSVNPSDYQFTIVPKAKMDEKAAFLRSTALKDVKAITNGYSFHTEYEASTIVKTQMGYDEGWHAYAEKEDGSRVNCQMLRLDGGLTGFVAPKGKVSYHLVYETPKLKTGVLLSILGILGYSAYLFVSFRGEVKRKRKETELTVSQ